MCRDNIIHLVRPEVLNGICVFRNSLVQNPDFNLVRKNRICSFLKKNANKHSVEIEFTNKNKKNLKEKALENLTIAKDYLCRDFKGELNEEQIKNAASLINGYNEQIPYRTVEARTVDKGGFFIYPKDVFNEMYKFISKNKQLRTAVEKAIHSHFNIARIHPFEDGNGRLARLIQNTFLDYNKYPPIIIPSFERKKYLNLLNNAAREYREQEGALKPKQARFYNYLSSKLKDSLKEIERQIKYKNKI